jgi:hypothetical protein
MGPQARDDPDRVGAVSIVTWGWRVGWLAFDPSLLLAADEPTNTTNFWRQHRSEAIGRAVAQLEP